VSRDIVLEFAAIAPQAQLLVAYGSTEVEPISHITSEEILATPSLSEDDPELVDNGVIVGHFAEGLKYKFVRLSRGPIRIDKESDWAIWELAPGANGEIIVAGEHVCRDYYNDPLAFERAKILDPQGVVWHRTGDVGYLDARGNLWLVGRVHNAIIRGGEYYFPVKAEVIMKRLPWVKQAAYLGIADETLGEKVIGVVAPQDPALLADQAQCAAHRQEIERLMAKNQLPVDGIIFREQILMDPRHNSKVEYDVLRRALL
jgi:acyl-CoA synthetase (AMP-forming)/AMP-acid ligase II